MSAAAPDITEFDIESASVVNIMPGAQLSGTGNWKVGDNGTSGLTGSLVQTGGTLDTAGDLYLGDDEDDYGEYRISGGSITIRDDLKIGDEGGGKIVQEGGIISVYGYAALGGKDNVESVGIYEMSGGQLLFPTGGAEGDPDRELMIGEEWEGTFTQTGGSIGPVNRVVIGGDSTNHGVYNISGTANLEIEERLYLADGGLGEMNQSGGSVTIGDHFYLGDETTGSGTLTMSGGTLSLGGDYKVGDDGTGTVIQSGGAITSTGDLFLGKYSTDVGNYTLSGTGSVEVVDDLKLGEEGIGTLTQTGGTMTVRGYVGIGNQGTGDGTYEISGGVLRHLGDGPDGSGNDMFDLGKGGGAAVLRVIGGDALINVVNYRQRSQGILELVLNDTGISTIDASGDLELAGTIDVSLDPSYTPTPGEMFDVIVAQGSRTGEFDTEILPPDFVLSYETGSSIVRLTVVPEPSSIVLLACGLFGLLGWRWRRRR